MYRTARVPTIPIRARPVHRTPHPRVLGNTRSLSILVCRHFPSKRQPRDNPLSFSLSLSLSRFPPLTRIPPFSLSFRPITNRSTPLSNFFSHLILCFRSSSFFFLALLFYPPRFRTFTAKSTSKGFPSLSSSTLVVHQLACVYVHGVFQKYVGGKL